MIDVCPVLSGLSCKLRQEGVYVCVKQCGGVMQNFGVMFRKSRGNLLSIFYLCIYCLILYILYIFTVPLDLHACLELQYVY